MSKLMTSLDSTSPPTTARMDLLDNLVAYLQASRSLVRLSQAAHFAVPHRTAVWVLVDRQARIHAEC